MIRELLKRFWPGTVEEAAPDDDLSLAEIEAMLAGETKFIRAKRRFVQQQKFMVEGSGERATGRLPPGQTLTQSWPVLDLGIKPAISSADWTLSLEGDVEHPTTIGWQDLLVLPQVSPTSDIHCVTAWSCFDNQWMGVAIRDIIGLCRPRPTVKAVMVEGFDGYKTNLKIEDLAAETSLLAHGWSAEPLTLDHGGPVRLVVPHLYFWKSAKWIKSITFLDEERRGYWEVGYHIRGDPWLQQRYRGSEES